MKHLSERKFLCPLMDTILTFTFLLMKIFYHLRAGKKEENDKNISPVNSRIINEIWLDEL